MYALTVQEKIMGVIEELMNRIYRTYDIIVIENVYLIDSGSDKYLQ